MNSYVRHYREADSLFNDSYPEKLYLKAHQQPTRAPASLRDPHMWGLCMLLRGGGQPGCGAILTLSSILLVAALQPVRGSSYPPPLLPAVPRPRVILLNLWRSSPLHAPSPFAQALPLTRSIERRPRMCLEGVGPERHNGITNGNATRRHHHRLTLPRDVTQPHGHGSRVTESRSAVSTALNCSILQHGINRACSHVRAK